MRNNGVFWDIPIDFISNENAKKDAALRRKQRMRTPKIFWLDSDFDDKKYDDFYSKYKFS